jgi:integrase
MRKSAPTCPLTAHRNGQWCKKVKGKIHYFGTDKDKALKAWAEQRDYLLAGLTPPADTVTVGNILDAFMDTKQRALGSGEIADRTFKEYESVCDIIAEVIGKRKNVEHITPSDFAKLRTRLATKKNGEPASPVSVKRLLTFARMAFHYANEELGHSIKYKKPLRTPAAKMIREARHAIGQRLFEAEEIRQIVKAATPELRAMILLGINCGFGPGDCANLPISALDLERGWHNFPRPKTAMPRRCPLWPGTVKAIRETLKDRTEGPVFVGCWNRHVIARAFQAVCVGCGVYREGVTTFYTLRRTFETVACSGDTPQHVIDVIMGHAPDSSNMAAIYRQKVFDDTLRKCTDHVRAWVTGELQLE